MTQNADSVSVPEYVLLTLINAARHAHYDIPPDPVQVEAIDEMLARAQIDGSGARLTVEQATARAKIALDRAATDVPPRRDWGRDDPGPLMGKDAP